MARQPVVRLDSRFDSIRVEAGNFIPSEIYFLLAGDPTQYRIVPPTIGVYDIGIGVRYTDDPDAPSFNREYDRNSYQDLETMQKIYTRDQEFKKADGSRLEVLISPKHAVIKKLDDLETYGGYNPFVPESYDAYIIYLREQGKEIAKIRRKLQNG